MSISVIPVEGLPLIRKGDDLPSLIHARVPLRDGIYAEVTLVYERGEFRPLPWTYPDYRDPAQLAVLKALRERYREAVRCARG